MKDFGKVDLLFGLTKSIINGSPFYVKLDFSGLCYVLLDLFSVWF